MVCGTGSAPPSWERPSLSWRGLCSVEDGSSLSGLRGPIPTKPLSPLPNGLLFVPSPPRSPAQGRSRDIPRHTHSSTPPAVVRRRPAPRADLRPLASRYPQLPLDRFVQALG